MNRLRFSWAALAVAAAGCRAAPSAPAPPSPVAPEPGPAEFEVLGEDSVGALPTRLRHVPTGIVLVLVSPGTFTMGTPPDEEKRDGDEPQHEVVIGTPFYLAETEVTVGQWTRLTGSPSDDFFANDELPATGVSWHKAQELIALLNAEGEGGWRLPSEREWEYACRAGTTGTFYFGEHLTKELVNYNDRYPYEREERGLRSDGPVPVRSLPPNPWGLYEISGNVWEWCQDLYSFDPRVQAPEKPGAPRVMRGGAFTSKGKQIRAGYRDGYPPNSSGPKYGMRLAKSVKRDAP